jgi:hypothetical protein
MATTWKPQVGSTVKYRTANPGRVRHATITGVTSDTVLDLRVGRGATSQAVVGATKTTRGAVGAGWYR